MRIRSWLTRVALGSAVVAGVAGVPSAAFAGGSPVPFTDPNQVGSLTLCNQHGQPIVSGSLLTVPFVWRAVSSARVPAGYDRATLEVFQPIQYVDPADWTGYQLTDDAIFSNPAHPMAQATYADAPLIWPDQYIPPYWDGLYQLRMVFSAPDKIPWDSSYPTAVIKVTGQSWTLLQGGGSSCTDGTAVSVASLVLPKSETSKPSSPAKIVTSAAGGKGTKGGSSTGTSPSSSGGTTTTVAGAGAAGGSSAASAGRVLSGTSGKGGSPAGVIVGVVIAAVVLAVGAALLFFRRRRRVAA